MRTAAPLAAAQAFFGRCTNSLHLWLSWYSKDYSEILERKSKCHLHRMSAKACFFYSCWRAGWPGHGSDSLQNRFFTIIIILDIGRNFVFYSVMSQYSLVAKLCFWIELHWCACVFVASRASINFKIYTVHILERLCRLRKAQQCAILPTVWPRRSCIDCRNSLAREKLYRQPEQSGPGNVVQTVGTVWPDRSCTDSRNSTPTED